MNFVICKRNRLQTYLLTNLIINLMVLVDKENVKGYVQMDEKEHTKKEYASKGLAGTALGLGIGGLAVSLLNNGCNPLGIFGRNCVTNAGEVAIAANEQYLERKQCADFVELVNGMMKILVVLKLGITLKQLIEFILDLLLRQYVFLNMLPLLLFIYLIQKIYYFSLFFFK